MGNSRFSQEIVVFHGRHAPERGLLVGYGAVASALRLPMPMPDRLALIGARSAGYEVPGWQVLGPRYRPGEDLYPQLVFALKYEGVDLLFFKRLFQQLSQNEVLHILAVEPTGRYSRKLWFLYEWLMGRALPLRDIGMMNYVPLLDPAQQIAVEGTRSKRHRIIDNLPGTPDLCPLVRRTAKLDAHMASGLAARNSGYVGGIRKDVMRRAAAFLLLKDSRASFTIEGEQPRSQRAARWGNVIAQAGRVPLNREELERLQQVVIEGGRFTPMGYRTQGGFVGEHDRATGEPLPDHISARWQDVDALMRGLFAMNERLAADNIDAVVAAALVSFAFVFIHPFVDGNGRLHRYLVHHVLAAKGFSPPGLIFPVSAAILDHINDYRDVLEARSRPLLGHIEWRTTADNNVEVLNDTADLYRYYDATAQAEFLYDQVADTVDRIIPEEVRYLFCFDEMKRYLNDRFEMPDRTVDLLVRFLEQGAGRLSRRALQHAFKALRPEEAKAIEERYAAIFCAENRPLS